MIAAKRHLRGRQNHCVRGRQHHRIWTLIWGGGNHVAYRPYYYYYYVRTTHPCARNKFFKHIHNFLWALPSWKSLAPVHKMMGKITRKNIINICSSYRPCPVRSNIEKSTSGKPIGDRLAHPRYFLTVPWAPGRHSCPVSGPTLARTHSSAQQGAPSVVGIRCLMVASRGIREPSEEEGGTQQPLPAVPGNPV